jgi:hypothetical protein
MGYFIAMIIGYVLGARVGSKDLDELSRSVQALRESEEFGDVVAAARSHVGHTLRELAGIVDGRSGARSGPGMVSGTGAGSGSADGAEADGEDLVERVRHIFGQPTS